MRGRRRDQRREPAVDPSAGALAEVDDVRFVSGRNGWLPFAAPIWLDNVACSTEKQRVIDRVILVENDRQ